MTIDELREHYRQRFCQLYHEADDGEGRVGFWHPKLGAWEWYELDEDDAVRQTGSTQELEAGAHIVRKGY